MNAAMPDLPAIQRANRSFLGRAVRFLTAAGIRQFLDLGSGIPTVGNVHEIAQSAAPESRVVYVDIDPVAVAHGQSILAGNDRVVAIHGDLRRPDVVLADPRVHQVLDFTMPMAVLMAAVLHFVSDDDDPAGIVARYRDAVVPGSFLVISHASQGSQQRQRTETAMNVANRNDIHMMSRDRVEITRFLAGFELFEPGLVYTSQWRPDQDTYDFDGQPERAGGFVGVGIKV
jgi:S-adenosyl methyltransferase